MEAEKNLEWFALSSNYGSEFYGSIVHSYQVIERPRLINVGLDSVRAVLKQRAEFYEGRNLDFTADTQWSGGRGNHRFTTLVHRYFRSEYDGTIVVSDNSPPGSIDEENEGATEIVLWGDQSRFLSLV